ncbi:7193_t:CDS:2 [Dentiscutata heterogama]|uniref:7193_t:CDS:1 n=1 Tax=Dentiscutata heterogama TaxID=1316150 RepID=A0ACA9MAN7_9GLOM|nr:7193_t:CDS:2 [Dentiscutata heterogama]
MSTFARGNQNPVAWLEAISHEFEANNIQTSYLLQSTNTMIQVPAFLDDDPIKKLILVIEELVVSLKNNDDRPRGNQNRNQNNQENERERNTDNNRSTIDIQAMLAQLLNNKEESLN